ncbi:PilX N-terminal domain-containing pilus assembly protein [Microbulbifer taiwanensis]|uniref:PilX N-terminal domain-containing pilus assembly protein n=1 Tax=Microbulbifer taiwanensis TaxID=986746 RepID=A0ABW1YSI9_9GAMM|nr:PilX N-terminal domain-containing pilus assembly protein [Microbulbifer taiwanensis]
MSHSIKSAATQQGAVLVVSLILLLVLSLIAVSSARGVLLGERMVSASRDSKYALEVAESMARKGEQYIESLQDTNSFGSTNWLHSIGSGPNDLSSLDTWTDKNSVEWPVAMGRSEGKTMTGRIYIELAGSTSDKSNASDVDISAGVTKLNSEDIQVFKVVTRGTGPAGTERILTTLYGKAF